MAKDEVDRQARDEELRMKLKHAIVPAFDRWSAKNLDTLFSKAKNGNQRAAEEAQVVDWFMSKRVFDSGFMRYVTRRVVASADCQRQRRTLVKASLLSILHEAGLSPSELVAGPDSKPREPRRNDKDESRYYTRKRVQGIMRDVYHETFFKLPSASNRKERPDGRTSRYSTVFSPSREPQLQNPKEVIDFQTLDFHALRSRPDLIQRLYLNDSISNVTPEKINDMLSFRKLCSELLLEIGDYSKLGKLLAKELEQTTYIFSVFHAHTLSIISIEWFRSRRESQKRALINDGFPFKYTSDEAAKAAVLLADLTFGNLDWVVSLMQIAEQAFLQYQMFAHCRLIDQRLLVMKQGDALWTGILHENIAVSYRNESKPKLMVSEMKRAIDSYRKSGDTYRVCVG